MLAHSFKRVIAKLSVAVLLFAQLAVAAYACPGDSAAGAVAASSIEAMHEAMPGCEMNSGSNNPNLCAQHCQAGDQSVQTLPHINVPPLAAIPTLVIVDAVLTPQAIGAALLSERSALVPLPPPLVRFGVLRI